MVGTEGNMSSHCDHLLSHATDHHILWLNGLGEVVVGLLVCTIFCSSLEMQQLEENLCHTCSGVYS